MRNRNFNVETINSEHWERFYAGNLNLNESTFCAKIKKDFKGEYLILDIGCGSGRDSFSFAEAGFDVIAVDRSQEAISKNSKIAMERKLNDTLRFIRIDLAKQRELEEKFEIILRESKEKNKKIILYLRFLLHAIDEVTERILLNVLSDNLPRDSYFVAEFRTLEDENKTKTYDDHYRRFICAETFVETLKSRGFLLTEFHKGTGLSKYKEEDPFLARVIAKKL